MSEAKKRDIAKECIDGLRLIREKMQRSAKENTLIVGLTPEEVKFVINNSIMAILAVDLRRQHWENQKEDKNEN